MQKPKRMYCVYQHGIGEMIANDLTHCFRFIAKKLKKRTSQVTAKEAFDAGFEISDITNKKAA